MNSKISEQFFGRFNYLFVAVVIITTVTIAYFNSFHVSFVFDDIHNIVENPSLKFPAISFASLQKAATESPCGWRFFPNISFALNYFYGGQNVFGYHLVNLILHISTALVFYSLALSTLKLPVLSSYHKYAREIALFAALLWALNPVQTNAVTYIVQRMTCMAAFFSVSALLCYVHGRLQDNSFWKRFCLYGAGLFCFGMALFSKENSAMLPVIVLAYELFFFQDIDLGKDWRRLLVVSVIAMGSVLALGCFIMGRVDIFHSIPASFGGRDFNLAERLLTESRVLFYYLGLLVLPLPSRLKLDYDFVISQSIISPPQTLAALLGLVGLCVLIVILYRKGHRLAGFAIFWYLANLAIESSILPLELVYEHRLYMPSMFLALALAALLYHLARNQVVISRVVLVCIAALFLLMTWQRNATWASPYDFWQDNVTKSPNSARVHVNLSNSLKDKGDYTNALKHLQKAIELEPDYGMAYLNLGLLYKDINLLQQSITILTAGLDKKRVAPAKIYYALGLVYGQLGNYQQAIKMAKMGLHVEPGMLKPYVVMGIAYDELGDLDTAYGKFAEARFLGHDSSSLFYNWALTCMKMGRRSEALDKLAEGIALYPGDNKLISLRSRIARGM